jgi:uncharacterized protein with GYD domain
MVLGSYTSESWKRMIDNPGDRSAAARQACEAVGGTLEAFYWAFGPDDVMGIADLPDDTSAGAFSVAVSSSGAFRGVRTVRLLTLEEGQELLRLAKTVVGTYRHPGT